MGSYSCHSTGDSLHQLTALLSRNCRAQQTALKGRNMAVGWKATNEKLNQYDQEIWPVGDIRPWEKE